MKSLTIKQEKAAFWVAQDQLTNERICDELAINPLTLTRWKHLPEFKECVEEHRKAAREAVLRQGIGMVENRVQRLHDGWLRLQQVIKERAESEEMQTVPGGKTGLLTRQIKGIGRGPNFQVVEEFSLDTGLLGELRAHEKQAAQELQQWVDKTDGGLTDDDVKRLIEQRLAKLAALRSGPTVRESPDGDQQSGTDT